MVDTREKKVLGIDKLSEIVDALPGKNIDTKTPLWVFDDALSDYDEEFWKDPSNKFLDLTCGYGNPLVSVCKKLLQYHAAWHIINNMIFGSDINPAKVKITKAMLELATGISPPDENFKVGDALSLEWNMKFDLVIGNPPYQIPDEGENKNSASSLYHLFVEKAIEISTKKVCILMPARWYTEGKGMNEFRKRMLNSTKIFKLRDYFYENDIFPDVTIRGGVCVFHWDQDYAGECDVLNIEKSVIRSSETRPLNEFDVLVRHNEGVDILRKIMKVDKDFVGDHVCSRNAFGFVTNFTDFDKPSDTTVKLYHRHGIADVERHRVKFNDQIVDKYKVLMSARYGFGSSEPHQITGKAFIARPGECCTETYLVLKSFDDLESAKAFHRYVQTKFFRFMVGLRANTQNFSKSRFNFAPVVLLNEDESDQTLYERYNLRDHEIEFVERFVKKVNWSEFLLDM